jgi:hypothetical protein
VIGLISNENFHQLIIENKLKQFKDEINNNPELLSGDNARDLLLTTAVYNNRDCMMILIEYGVDINEKDKDGGTILMDTVIFGRFQIAQLLLKYGATFEYDRFSFKADRKHMLDYDKWYQLFGLYNAQSYQEDTEWYHECRLQALFIES